MKGMVSVLIPVYKSEDILPTLYERLVAVLDGLDRPFEILFVCDCSPDGSWGVLRRLSERDGRVKAILLRRNFGLDGALMAGLSYVSGEYIVTMDDDLQHAPEDIPRLLAAIEQGQDLVYATFPRIHEAWLKRLGSMLNGAMARVLLNKPKGIYLSAFKVFRAGIAAEARQYTGPYPYVDGLLLLTTSAIGQIEAEHHARFSGSGNFTLLRSLRTWLNHATSFSVYPLRLTSIAGFLCAAVSIATALYWFFWRLFGGVAPEGWATTIVALFFIGGLQLIALGVIGEYLGRAYLTLNHRPQHVVRETCNLPKRPPG